MSKNFIIEIQIYQHDLMVSIGESDATLFKKLSSVGIDETELVHAEYEKAGMGRYCLFENGQSLLRIKQVPKTPEDYGYLHHEIFHVVSGLMWRIGVKMKIKTSDECYAYLIGYLTEEIYKKI